ncbi:hypothetical protein ZOSMA_146G00320 [Zostera marina]|uniref:Uncharacterized protein n=1 Tax=Zostera marina TaxID=29655 RepID=A0A0K9PZ89_ZOSMR|nr:hypothetical protein ZOSMA_146G00320 [Zostera marina]
MTLQYDSGVFVEYQAGQESTIQDENFIQYDKKLKETINRHYDQSEYEELLKNATEQKFTSKLKVLRIKTISYTTEKKGKALLDHHPDLAAKTETADCHSGLILLRGFFFWIQNLSHKGSYMPWKNKSSTNDIICIID